MRFTVTEIAFRQTKKSGNFGQKSNGEVCFGLFGVDLFALIGGTRRTVFDKPFHCPFTRQQILVMCGLAKEWKKAKAIHHGWPDLIRKCRFTFFLSYSNRSRPGWHNENRPEMNTDDAF